MPAATTQISFLFVLLSFAACGSSSSPGALIDCHAQPEHNDVAFTVVDNDNDNDNDDSRMCRNEHRYH